MYKEIKMNITDLLRNSGALGQLASQYNLGDNQVEDVVKSVLPEFSKNINRNTANPDGLKSFMDAINDHKNDPVDDMLNNIRNVDSNDGDKILGHIFGNDKQEVEKRVSKNQGIDIGSVSGILKNLAPLLMGLFGRQVANRSNLTGSTGGGFLESFLGGDSPVAGGLQSMLDRDGDGDIMDDTLDRFL